MGLWLPRHAAVQDEEKEAWRVSVTCCVGPMVGCGRVGLASLWARTVGGWAGMGLPEGEGSGVPCAPSPD